MPQNSMNKLKDLFLDIEDQGKFVILEDEEVRELKYCYKCASSDVEEDTIQLHPNMREQVVIKVKKCAICGRIHIPFRTALGTIAVLATSSDYHGILEKTQAYRNKTITIKDAMTAKEKLERQQKIDQQESIWSSFSARKPEKDKKQIGIEKKVFLVKGHTFTCEKAGHEIERIEAKIDVMDKRTAHARVLTVPAGYCKQCRRHFIFASEYERILEVGVPICNVVNIEEHGHKTYKNPKYDLHETSILMQYGYNVNAQENLSSETRHRILGLLIDYNICTPTKIVSYLNYFIKQRRNRSNMENAISKWEEDIRFVNGYHFGSTKEVWVDELRNYHPAWF